MNNETKQAFRDALNGSQIIFWQDPGHGWLQVPLPLVQTLIKENDLKISGYSYKDTNFAYLEEDCDLTAFANCFPWENFQHIFQQIQTKHKENIFIRSLNRF
jgi:hypothetical protein